MLPWLHEIIPETLKRGYHDIIGGIATLDFAGTKITYYRGNTHGGHKIRFRAKSERDIMSVVHDHIDDTDTVWDIGANIGPHSMAFGQLATEVHAFEPHPENAKQLSKNIIASGVEDHVTIHEHAIGDQTGSVTFTGNDAEVGSGTPHIGDGSLTVDVYRGDDLVTTGEISQPNVVKIDVEGAEGRVINGMKESLQDVRLLVVELHRHGGNRPSLQDYSDDEQGIRTTIKNLGFELHREEDRGSEAHTVWLQS